MSRNASKEETVFAAKYASFSSTVAAPQIGGAAAMTQFDKYSPMAGAIIERFLRYHVSLLSNVLSLVGTSDEETVFIDRTMRNMKLNGSQHAFSLHYANMTKQPDLAKYFGPATKWLSSKGSLSDLAHSIGICQIIKSLKEVLLLREKPRVVIVGFGSVGSSIAYFLENQNIGQIVAICDSDGFVKISLWLQSARALRKS
jgi:hypothetical protein